MRHALEIAQKCVFGFRKLQKHDVCLLGEAIKPRISNLILILSVAQNINQHFSSVYLADRLEHFGCRIEHCPDEQALLVFYVVRCFAVVLSPHVN